MAFTYLDQQIPRPVDKRRKKNFYSGIKKKIKTQLMVNNQSTIIHKTNYKKGRRHDYDIYKKDYPVTPKEVVNIFDLGYLSRKRLQNNYLYRHTERREIKIYLRKRKNTTKIILKKE